MSDESNDSERFDDTSMNFPLKVGLTLIFLVFGVFGVWSSIAPLDGAVHGLGKVTVSSYSKTIQHLEGGIVTEMFVRNGDRVSAGQPLLKLDDTQSLAQLEIVSAQLTTLQVKETRLLAERDEMTEFIIPSELFNESGDITREVDVQTEIFEARRSAMQGSIEILERRIDQLHSRISGLQVLSLAKQELAESYKEEIADIQRLVSNGFSDRVHLRDLQRVHSIEVAEAAELVVQIASTQMEVGEAELQIIQSKKEFYNEVVSERAQVQSDIHDMEERARALNDVVKRTTVIAPVAGIVNDVQFHTVGGVVGPGMKILDIVPEDDELLIEAKVSAVDIDRVALDQETTIRFSTFGNVAPTVFGQIVHISADSFLDEASGSPYYQIRIEVLPESQNQLKGLVLLPGMPAEVFVATGERTFFQYISKPLSNSLARSFNEE